MLQHLKCGKIELEVALKEFSDGKLLRPKGMQRMSLSEIEEGRDTWGGVDYSLTDEGGKLMLNFLNEG